MHISQFHGEFAGGIVVYSKNSFLWITVYIYAIQIMIHIPGHFLLPLAVDSV